MKVILSKYLSRDYTARLEKRRKKQDALRGGKSKGKGKSSAKKDRGRERVDRLKERQTDRNKLRDR